MKKAAIHLVVAISAMACLLLIIAWIGSYFSGSTFAAMSYSSSDVYQPPRDHGLLLMPGKVGFFADQRQGATPLYLFMLPYWPMVLLTAIAPAWWAVEYRGQLQRDWRARSGLCI